MVHDVLLPGLVIMFVVGWLHLRYVGRRDQREFDAILAEAIRKAEEAEAAKADDPGWSGSKDEGSWD